MSFEIKNESAQNLIILGAEVSIAEARDFHAAVLTLALDAKPLAIDARAVQTIHTSILQILFSLRRGACQISVHGASAQFTASIERLGLNLLGATSVDRHISP